MLIQVLKHINWLGLLYFLANNGLYQVLFAKYTDRQNIQRIRRVENSTSQNQPEIAERSSQQNIFFAILVISWFLHNAVSLYMLDFESSGRMIYERVFQEHVNYIKARSHLFQTDFIKSLLCEQPQITLALILVALCFLHKNTFWKALLFVVASHFILSYRAATIEEGNPVIETDQRNGNFNSSSSYKNAEYYKDIVNTNIIENSRSESPQQVDEVVESFKSGIKEDEGYFPAHVAYIESKEKEETREALLYNKQTVDETKKVENNNNDDEDCFKELSWLAYIPLKTISVGLEATLDAGQLFEYIVCKWIIG